MDGVHDAKRLAELQALPLNRKIQITQTRIIEWYQHYNGKVVVSFSGGKDSTVLLHLVRQIYPDVPAVFSNTGLEYPEIVKFAHSFPNVDVVTPKMRFSEVISTYGYPLIGKEVAEAIYYARRIRSQTVQVEREREREQQAERSANCWESAQQADSCRKAIPARQTMWKRLEMRGGGESEAYQDELREKPQNDLARENVRKNRGSKWGNYHRRCLNPDETDEQDRERFWNGYGHGGYL